MKHLMILALVVHMSSKLNAQPKTEIGKMENQSFWSVAASFKSNDDIVLLIYTPGTQCVIFSATDLKEKKHFWVNSTHKKAYLNKIFSPSYFLLDQYLYVVGDGYFPKEKVHKLVAKRYDIQTGKGSEWVEIASNSSEKEATIPKQVVSSAAGLLARFGNELILLDPDLNIQSRREFLREGKWRIIKWDTLSMISQIIEPNSSKLESYTFSTGQTRQLDLEEDNFRLHPLHEVQRINGDTLMLVRIYRSVGEKHDWGFAIIKVDMKRFEKLKTIMTPCNVIDFIDNRLECENLFDSVKDQTRLSGYWHDNGGALVIYKRKLTSEGFTLFDHRGNMFVFAWDNTDTFRYVNFFERSVTFINSSNVAGLAIIGDAESDYYVLYNDEEKNGAATFLSFDLYGNKSKKTLKHDFAEGKEKKIMRFLPDVTFTLDDGSVLIYSEVEQTRGFCRIYPPGAEDDE